MIELEIETYFRPRLTWISEIALKITSQTASYLILKNPNTVKLHKNTIHQLQAMLTALGGMQTSSILETQ
jgi:hypothetical protein